ncbi:hypothetical protein PPROV_000572900 [Pycnococcus provasolii]|uniref:GMP synthase [glutamine-hydrolyzing] n=1 Tax=Pycnococcus provasolii TaxID=41880 RepID=A0A830HI30_9CHLO|nr:hypothetical protein PPROV_000572900 [Pycnococcus provasolii]
MEEAQCVILDYGSQYTQLIARRVREQSVYSMIVPGDSTLERVTSYKPRLVVLSGGPNSVMAEGAPTVPDGLFEYCASEQVPVLGICYGLQLIVHSLGGEVVAGETREYGRMEVTTDLKSLLYHDEHSDKQMVWMSHGDVAKTLPDGFRVVGRSSTGAVVAIEHAERRIYGLQYHPEVMHSERGVETLRRALFDVAKCDRSWDMQSALDSQLATIRTKIGNTKHAVCALSGGVDSAVAATLVHKAIGDRLHCVFVDNGLLRYKEQERVRQMFKEHLHLPVTIIDASERQLTKLKGVSDPEKKRKAIGAEFIAIFQEFAEKLERDLGHKAEFLVQGTLYPDVIESCPPPGSGQKHSHVIKSHHNVGGLPEKLGFDLVEPLRWLFKDEVRKLGLLMGVPEVFIKRHPFPGPGLAVRCLGDVTAEPRALDVLRDVDEIFINALREFDLYDQIWQAFAVFLPIKSVGVQGDQRSHKHVVGLRAITSSDGMTADWFRFSGDFLAEVSNRITNQVSDVNRVVYDITSKPPSTVEWE